MGFTGTYGTHGDRRKPGFIGEYGVHGPSPCWRPSPEPDPVAAVESVLRDGLAPALFVTLDRAVEAIDISAGISAIQVYITDQGWMPCYQVTLQEVSPGTGYRIIYAEWDVDFPEGDIQWRISGPTPEVSPPIGEAAGTITAE